MLQQFISQRRDQSFWSSSYVRIIAEYKSLSIVLYFLTSIFFIVGELPDTIPFFIWMIFKFFWLLNSFFSFILLRREFEEKEKNNSNCR